MVRWQQLILCGVTWPLDICMSPSLRTVRLEAVLQVPGMVHRAPVLNVHCINHYSRYIPSSAGGTVLASGEMPLGGLTIVKASSIFPAASPAVRVTKCSQRSFFFSFPFSTESFFRKWKFCTPSLVILLAAPQIFPEQQGLSMGKKFTITLRKKIPILWFKCHNPLKRAVDLCKESLCC